MTLYIYITSLPPQPNHQPNQTQELGPNLHIMNADVVDSKAMQKGLEDLPPGFRAIDVLVNNAGLGLGKKDLPLTTYDSDMLIVH